VIGMPFSTAPRQIRSVLVANRGEIACRIMQTCRRLGLRSVAVYSDADRDALHVRSADEAHRLGPAKASESYLDIEAVVRAVRATGADAVHPGYGFLSENAAFVRRLEAEGIVFVGPSSGAVSRMGSKIEAKKIAEAAGVATVPGYLGDDQSPARLAAEAERIGWPVLIKASAGGGGRGMRLVERPDDFVGALAAATREAHAAFGDDAVLLERFVARPRHLEVQVIGDTHGNLLHLFERDCSVQRNNQKVIEEAPAPNLPEDVRGRLLSAAVTLTTSIGYTSAGTVEFIMEEGGTEPYFLEMNTRLQVEHPVTEAITGIDLVEWQLRVAAGLPLPVGQDAIVARGHAIEVRLASERPDAGFQPSTGRFHRVAPPSGLRWDSGIADGSSVGLHYDSMIAKLIAHGGDRSAALARLRTGLGELGLLGPATNQAFLADSLAAPAFAEGRATTRFLAETFPDGWRPAERDLATVRALAAAAWTIDSAGSPLPWQRRDGFRVMGARRGATVPLVLADEYGTTDVLLTLQRGCACADVGAERVDLGRVSPTGFTLEFASAFTHVNGSAVHAAFGGLSIAAEVTLAAALTGATDVEAAGPNAIVAPLPGIVSDIAVIVGDHVTKGAAALQMEAMKLVHTIAFGRDGVVSAIHCAAGDTVPAGAVLIELAREEG
jgi:acetyl/propionyl-CoA carboxylase alpha subunit